LVSRADHLQDDVDELQGLLESQIGRSDALKARIAELERENMALRSQKADMAIDFARYDGTGSADHGDLNEVALQVAKMCEVLEAVCTFSETRPILGCLILARSA
jgi:hypothetical protein